jgi:ParB family chromosome partitioning protein
MERRLGRGLGSLLGNSSVLEDQKRAQDLPLEVIRPNPFQPRKTFDPAALEELADSIRRHGILQPIVVRPVSDGEAQYEIVAGERRWRASRIAGLSVVPAVVRELRDEQMLELALVENVQRKDLDAIERATGYQQMIRALKITQEQVAEKVGLQRATVANHLRLLELPPAAQEAVRRDLISMGHARALLGISDPTGVLALVERIAREDLSVREVERIVRESGRKKAGTSAVLTPPQASPPWVRELEERMRQRLGTKVQLRNNPGYRGQIVIEYFNRTDLDRLCQVLAPRDELR